MVLALAVIAGLTISLVRYRGHAFSQIASIPLRTLWLVVLAVALQWPLLQMSGGTPAGFRVQQALFLLSYVLLAAFVGRNWHLASMWVAGLGILCNLLVIVANGGWMPITLETLARINPELVGLWVPGMHYGHSKDLILLQEQTRLWILSDIWVAHLPPVPPVAFSLGDVLLAIGCMLLLAGPVTLHRAVNPKTDQC